MKRIKAHYPENDIYFLGTSLGGNYLFRYLTRDHENPQPHIQSIKAFTMISAPFDVNYVVDKMKK